MKTGKPLLFLLLFLLLTPPAFAVEPGEMLKDPVLESRAREISKSLRCLVCQGQDIDDSHADLAADIRKLVREKLSAGSSDAEVFDFIRQRYGDYVLMRPPLEIATLVLWLTPVTTLAAGLAAAFFFIRRQNRKGS
jgi:cytochrome c-type biogenesis protein CcmH